MKRSLFFLIALCLIATSVLQAQSVGDYGSAANGNWGTAGTWVVCQTNGTWEGTTAATSLPTSATTISFFVRSGHTVILEASPKYCYNLTVESGAQLYANAVVTSPKYLRVCGTTVKVDGTLGASSGSDALGLYLPNADQTVTITGSGVIGVSRIQPSTTGQTVIFDANVNVNYAGSSGTGSTGLYANNKDNTTFTINAGKTVVTAPYSYLAAHSSSATSAADANFTLNVYGTLTTGNNAHVNLNNSATLAKTSTLHVYNGGTINLGGNLNGNTSTTEGGAINIIVDQGGAINFTGNGQVNLGASTTTVNGTITMPSKDSKNASFGNLVLNSSSGLTLNDTTTVGTLTLTSGNFNINGYPFTYTTLTGTNGTITDTQSLNAPAAINVSNLGAVITSNSDLGSTVVKRGFSAQTVKSKSSILRWYDITPTTNTGLNATLVFKYDDSELNGLAETDLTLYSSTDNGLNWIYRGGVLDITTNQITLTGINAFSMWTMSEKPELGAQVVGDFGSKATGDWGTDGTNWVVCVLDGSWDGAAAATAAPTINENVWIRSGHTVTTEASSKVCKNLIVESGASLLTTTKDYSIAINGDAKIDGVMGSSTVAHCIQFNISGKIYGSGTVYFSRLRPNANDVTITVDMNIYGYTAAASFINANKKNNFTLVVNAGKTITLPTGGYISTASNSSTADPTDAANVTYNVYGTIIAPINTGGGINLANKSGFRSILNIYNGGAVNTGRLSALSTSTVGPDSVIVNVYTGGSLNIQGGSGANTNDMGKANLNVEGTFTTGTDLTSNTIGNCTINNVTGVNLSCPTTVSGTLTLTSGNLFLNGNTLTYLNITGTNGTISDTQTLTAPTAVNVGNLGAIITSGADLGSTVVKRGFIAKMVNTGNSIKRWYTITPTTNTGLDVTLVFKYEESELNGLTEANLALYSSVDEGALWTEQGGLLDATNNQITLTGIDAFSLWTAAKKTIPPPDVFFSEYIEGSSNNKAIEIYNGTGGTIDLSQFSVKQANNGYGWGNTSAGADTRYVLPLTGSLAAGDVYVITNDQAGADIFTVADLVLTYNTNPNGAIGSNVASFNGDDAMGLFYDNELIDVIGIPTVDPGTNWVVAGTGATSEFTLVRKTSVVKGNTNWAVSTGTNATDSEWEVYPQDTFEYLGEHPTIVIPLKISKARSVSLTEIELVYTDTLESVNVADYSVLGSSGITFSSANIDAADGTIVKLTASANIVGDAVLDTLVDAANQDSIAFYIGITPMAFTNTMNPGGKIEKGITATFKGIVYANDAYSDVWFADGSGAYHGLSIYNNAFVSKVTIGDEIIVSATLDVYNNMTELKNPDLISKTSGATPYSAFKINGADIDTAQVADTNPAEQYENQLVEIDSARVLSYSSYQYYCTDDGINIFKVGGQLDYHLLKTPMKIGSMYNITGAIDYYYGFYCINPRDSLDVVLLNTPPSAFSLIRPIDGDMITDADVVQDSLIAVKWTKAVDPDGDAVTYKLYVLDATMAVVEFTAEVSDTSNLFEAPTYEDNGKYYMYVLAFDPLGTFSSSDTVSFTIKMNAPPASFTVLKPTEGYEVTNSDVVQDSLIEVKWTKAVDPNGDAITYKLFILNADKDSVTYTIETPDTSNLIKAPTYEDNGNYKMYVLAYDILDAFSSSDTVNFTINMTSEGIKGDLIPKVFALHQNYPNPFNPITTIKYDLPKETQVKIVIYNIIGREVRTLVNEKQTAGYQQIQWNARDNYGKQVSSGFYICVMDAGDFHKSQRMMLIK